MSSGKSKKKSKRDDKKKRKAESEEEEEVIKSSDDESTKKGKDKKKKKKSKKDEDEDEVASSEEESKKTPKKAKEVVTPTKQKKAENDPQPMDIQSPSQPIPKPISLQGDTSTAMVLSNQNTTVASNSNQNAMVVSNSNSGAIVAKKSGQLGVSPNYWYNFKTGLRGRTRLLYVTAKHEKSEGGFRYGFKKDGDPEFFEEIMIRTPPLMVKHDDTYGVGVLGDKKNGPETRKYKLTCKAECTPEMEKADPKLKENQQDFVDTMVNIILPDILELLWNDANAKPEKRKDIIAMAQKVMASIPDPTLQNKVFAEQCQGNWANLWQTWEFNSTDKRIDGKLLAPDDPKHSIFRFKAPVFYQKKVDPKNQQQVALQQQQLIGATPKPNYNQLPQQPPTFQQQLPPQPQFLQSPSVSLGKQTFIPDRNDPRYTFVSDTEFYENNTEAYGSEFQSMTKEEIWTTYHSVTKGGHGAYRHHQVSYADFEGKQIDVGAKKRDITHQVLKVDDLVETVCSFWGYQTAIAQGIQLSFKDPIYLIHRPIASQKNARVGYASSSSIGSKIIIEDDSSDRDFDQTYQPIVSQPPTPQHQSFPNHGDYSQMAMNPYARQN
jgi:hypothetical protein